MHAGHPERSPGHPERSPGHPERSEGSSYPPHRRLLQRAATGIAVGVVLWAALWALGAYDVTNVPPDVMLPVIAVGSAIIWICGPRPALGWLTAICVAAVAIIAWTPVIDAPVHHLIRSDPVPAHLDAVVVPSGGMTADNLLSSQTLDRLLTAVDVVHRGITSTIIVTESHASHSSRADQFHILTLTPAGTTILVAEDTRTTRDEAVKSAALAAPRGIHRIAVVTSPIHTRRACATFERVGFAVTCIPAIDRTTAVRTLGTPADRLLAFRQFVYESLGMMEYRWRGWV